MKRQNKKGKTRKNKERRFKNLIIAIAAIIILINISRICYLRYENSRIYDVREFNATFKIGKTIGFAVDSDKLNFGMSLPGGSTTRQVAISHDYKEPLKIKVIYSGSISEVLKPKKTFYLEPNKKINLSFTAYANSDKDANYSGTVKIMFIKT